MKDPIRVKLPVCPVCKATGLLPEGRGGRYKASCTGPSGDDHKLAKMVWTPFVQEAE